MTKLYIDAGTTYSKLISQGLPITELEAWQVKCESSDYFYIVPSSLVNQMNLVYEKSCGHMAVANENEIIALANGCRDFITGDETILDLGSRDAKWIKFKGAKFHDMDWNTSCASSTGATVEMLLKFYDIKAEDLSFEKDKIAVTCGVFGLERIMDEISKGVEASVAISKFVHGIAFNAWNFTKQPKKLYLSGGFCENECFVSSLKHYCDVESLGRFKLCEGLIRE